VLSGVRIRLKTKVYSLVVAAFVVVIPNGSQIFVQIQFFKGLDLTMSL